MAAMAHRPLTASFRKLKPHNFTTQGRRHSSQSQWGRIASNNTFLSISEEVREALHAKRPVVALETAIYTNGYPYPENIALASHLESIVRLNGGIPATVGILDGVAKVGLGAEDIIHLASSAGKENTLKLSRRDLSYVCGMRLAGKKFNGGTTIASTMVLAELAGIRVLATGGLGGVHRGAESSMDISADLTELGRTQVAVVSSGCKSFLDITRTIEYLETEGVGVATFADGRDGRVDFPSFYSRDSGVTSPMTIQTELEAAAMIYAQTTLPVFSGLLFGNPIPEDAAVPKAEMDAVIAEAINQADIAGATGNANTPFILNMIKKLTGGRSLIANKALISSNVERGTRVAKELATIEMNEGKLLIGSPNNKKSISIPVTKTLSEITPEKHIDEFSQHDISRIKGPLSQADIVVAGALAVDLSCDYAPFSSSSTMLSPQMHTSNPARITPTVGGVAHNIAKAIHLLGISVRLYSIVGDDLSGKAAVGQLEANGMDTTGIKILDAASGERTAQYVAVNDVEKNLVLAMADMNILESSHAVFDSHWATQVQELKPRWLVADANWKLETLLAWFKAGKAAGAMTAFEPVSTAKSARLFSREPNHARQSGDENVGALGVFPNHSIDLASPNALELAAMHTAAREAGLFDSPEWWRVVDAFGIPSGGLQRRLVQATSAELVDHGVPQQCLQLLPFMPILLTKLGARGVLLTMLLSENDPRLHSSVALPYILARRVNEDEESRVGGVYMRLFPPQVIAAGELVSVNGAGDTFLGAVIAGLAAGIGNVEDAIATAREAAVLTLKSRDSVSSDLKDLRGRLPQQG